MRVAELEGITACQRTLNRAFERERYFRRVATEKPFLTEKYRDDRLKWARLYVNWNEWQWSRVIWTDECSIACYYGQVYVTRLAEEKYDLSYCVPKFRGYSACMIWACITSQKKGPMVMFEKSWGKVTGDVYRQYIVPVIHEFKKSVDLPILMEDSASVYTARATRALHESLGILRMD